MKISMDDVGSLLWGAVPLEAGNMTASQGLEAHDSIALAFTGEIVVEVSSR
jgi:hypothetical protein